MMPRNLIKLVPLALAGGAVLALLAGLSVRRAIQPTSRLENVPAATSPRGSFSKTSASDTLTWTAALPLVIGPPIPVLSCSDVADNGNFEQPLPGHPWTGVANTSGVVYNDPFI